MLLLSQLLSLFLRLLPSNKTASKPCGSSKKDGGGSIAIKKAK